MSPPTSEANLRHCVYTRDHWYCIRIEAIAVLYSTPLTVNFKTISKLYIMWVIRYPRYYYSVDAIIVLDV